MRRRQPHALLALGHARKKLGVLAVCVVGALEVVPCREVVQEPHALVLGGEGGDAVKIAPALVLPPAAICEAVHLHTGAHQL